MVKPASQDEPVSEGPAVSGSSPVPTAPELPGWYPGWVRELAERFYAGTACLFVLHGNVHDLVRVPDGNGGETYLELGDVLATKVFGAWDLVLSYDLARGLRPSAGADAGRSRTMVETLTRRLADPATLSRDPGLLLPLLDRLIDGVVVDRASPKPRLVVLFPYAQHLVPEGDLAALSPAQEANLIRFLNWAQNPYIKTENIVFCLIADRLSEVNSRLSQSAHVATIAVPLPDRGERLRFIQWFGRAHDLSSLSDFSPEQLAELTNGLNLYNLQILLSQGVKTGRKLDAARFRELKKERIEQQCGGLLEFVEPHYSLDMLVGQEEAKARLRQDAQLIAQGALDAVPMGYLVCGPVGTGKSFLAECFAGSIGIPCVTLKNFRSKYVGETEGNLEQVLGVLRSLGPVVVVIDEADAALGTRQAEGDSGTSSRVFAMIARQMGDTRYRGRILWMLLTSRPDLLPIDLKRQGRAEVHIPLFYPQNVEEVREMLTVMGKKNKVALAPDALKDISHDSDQHLSGSDLESILIAARRRALAGGRKDVAREDLRESFERFLPSAQGLEKEMQEISAVLECTDMEFLPEDWQKTVSEPEGRRRLQERLVAIRQILRER